MQVRKVAVVATGALATAAAMGSTPAFADSGGAPQEAAPAVLGTPGDETQHQASDEAMKELASHWLTATPEQAWSAPWEQDPPQILSLGSGSAVSALALQNCGSSNVTGAGAAVPIASPNTVWGDCNNANISIEDSGDGALFSVLDNSALSIAPIQNCGSSNVTGAGLVAPIASPNTVIGDCNNGNISIGPAADDKKKHKKKHKKQPPKYGEPGYHDDSDYYFAPMSEAAPVEAEAVDTGVTEATSISGEPEQTLLASQAPWEVDPPQILSVGSGSAVSVAPIQNCGSTNVTGVGVAAPIASPNTVWGDCNNGNIKIHGDGGGALFSLLDNSAASIAPIQNCGSTNVTGAGAALPIASPNTVIGDCNNGNIKIRD